MARYDEASATFSLIARNSELLAEACLENQGTITESDTTPKVISDLLAHRLALRLDEDDNYIQVNRIVSQLFHHVTQSSRRRLSHGAIADLFNDLRHAVESYFEVRSAGSLDDMRTYEKAIHEIVSDLQYFLHTITIQFAGYVRNEFSTVSNLNQRIRENQRAIKEAESLNKLFSDITPEELSQLARSDLMLSKLLSQRLNREVRNCVKELHDVYHRLSENLTKLESDEKYQRQNKLIDSMLAHYERNPSYQPSINSLDRLPRLFSIVTPFKFVTHPPIDNPIEEGLLAEYAQVALNRVKASDKPVREIVKLEPVLVTDNSGLTVTQELCDIQQALINMFAVLHELTERGAVSSLDCLKMLKIDMHPKFWNLCVIDHYMNSDYGSGKEIQIRYIQEPVPNYNGNFIVNDIMFVRSYD